MSTRHPAHRSPSGSAGGADLRLHAPAAEPMDADGLAWVSWLFQSVRAQCTGLVFRTAAVERVEALADWQRFAGQVFLPTLAPALLRGWQSAQAGDDAALGELDRALHLKLDEDAARQSAAAGAILLLQTRGAKHQAALGRFRVRVGNGEAAGHLALVWAAVAALFQLPPLDLLAEYLREEWTVALGHVPHHEAPQGPLSFSGLAHRALHDAGVMGISE